MLSARRVLCRQNQRRSAERSAGRVPHQARMVINLKTAGRALCEFGPEVITARRERSEDPRELLFRRVIGVVSHSRKSQASACSLHRIQRRCRLPIQSKQPLTNERSRDGLQGAHKSVRAIDLCCSCRSQANARLTSVHELDPCGFKSAPNRRGRHAVRT